MASSDIPRMQSFPGKIGFPSDTSGDITATMTITGDVLEISTTDASIGAWPIDGLKLELGHRGYIVELDGEQIILSPHDRFGFNAAMEEAQQAVTVQNTRKGARRAKKEAKRAAKEDARAAKATAKQAEKAVEDPEVEFEPVPVVQEAPAAESVEAVTKAKPGKAPKPKRVSRLRTSKAADVDEPKPVPHVPGLEDPDKDALWATHRTEKRTDLRSRLNSATGARKAIYIGAAVMVALAIFAPAIATILLLLPGIAAVVLAGLSLLDPAYTRFMPGSFTELRLMLTGLGFFAASLVIAALR